jgi:hypothetical protein
MKPIATGTISTDARLIDENIAAIAAVGAGGASSSDINPYGFDWPVSPHIVAQRAGIVIDLERVANYRTRPPEEPVALGRELDPNTPRAALRVDFFAHHLTAHDTTAQAVPNIVPSKAAAWFHKTECFCFSPQAFARDGHCRGPSTASFIPGTTRSAPAAA